ncbi:MAG: response regulator FixJ [Burkholderiales bacterium]|jgi:CheY-like chemotaxis protein|nr:response regulator FixJ [Burkholderiales bacterium]
MHNYQIPIVYFPLKLMFVDDNPNILKTISTTLQEKYRCEIANSVDKALDILNSRMDFNYNLFTFEPNSEINLQAKNQSTKFNLSLNISNILKLVENTDKYNNIGIVITDYEMGDKNGLDLCRKIGDKQVKKILLTGQLDTSKGINAMNSQTIDRYIQKDSSTVVQDLKDYIETLHNVYFNQLFSINNNTLLNSDLYVLDNCDYIELFEDILLEHNIKEFYLIDSKGSFLMLNDSNERFVLNINTDKSLNDFIYTYQDEKYISSLIDGVRSRELVPFFGINTDPTSVELSQWYKHFYKPQIFKDFFWNWIKV